MCRYGKKAVLLAVIFSTGIASTSLGQSLWTDKSGDHSISVEFVKPTFAGNDRADFLTSITYLSGRFSIGRNTVGEIELPFARYGSTSEYADGAETAVGNPYIGAQINGGKVVSRIGVRLPTASTNDGSALYVGVLTDYDRFEAFLPDVLTVAGSFTGPTRVSSQFTLSFGAGPIVAIFTEDTGGDNAEVFAQYFLLAELEGKRVAVKAGLTGRALVTEGDLSFSERSVHQFGVGASLITGTFRPGLHMRLPLDKDLSESIDFVAGVNCTVVLD